MFGGIIDAIGRVRSCDDVPGGKTLRVTAAGYWTGTEAGASIAIDGVCLTVTRIDGEDATFDVVTETLRCTTLGDLRSGTRVNLQKSLAVGDRIDGHFVQGHVDATATISGVEESAAESKWWFAPTPGALSYVIPKGGVAVDGISLTVVDVESGRFSVALIPTTLERTTLGAKRRGDRVNIETDILARTVVYHLQSRETTGGGVDLETLRRTGFS